jgi:hypothetical protein
LATVYPQHSWNKDKFSRLSKKALQRLLEIIVLKNYPGEGIESVVVVASGEWRGGKWFEWWPVLVASGGD